MWFSGCFIVELRGHNAKDGTWKIPLAPTTLVLIETC